MAQLFYLATMMAMGYNGASASEQVAIDAFLYSLLPMVMMVPPSLIDAYNDFANDLGIVGPND